MANEKNLIPEAHKLTVEEQSKGGKKSAQSRRQKADIKKAVQAMLDGVYKDKKQGIEKTGAEVLALKLFEVATDPKNKQCVAAVKLIREIVGQNTTADDRKLKKAQLAYIQGRAELEIARAENEKQKLLAEEVGEMGDIEINITPIVESGAVDIED
ncbi:MAG: hypothetical protein IJR45_01025 [Firmicutes bacterium]|nr:hypothetical protein [Bacillota bacterium]MBQ9603974.1 hypothetical protein [Bacillota bacterium]